MSVPNTMTHSPLLRPSQRRPVCAIQQETGKSSKRLSRRLSGSTLGPGNSEFDIVSRAGPLSFRSRREAFIPEARPYAVLWTFCSVLSCPFFFFLLLSALSQFLMTAFSGLYGLSVASRTFWPAFHGLSCSYPPSRMICPFPPSPMSTI